jgi:hypothetical protein
LSGQSKLLIDEHPLQVLPSLAVKYGLNEAIILQQVHYWIRTKPIEKEGFQWTFSTFERWLKQFPFFSRRTLERAMANLEKSGALVGVVGLAEDARDRTKYYRIDYPVLEGASPAQSAEGQDDENCGDASRQNGGMGIRQNDGVHPAKMAVCIDKEEETQYEETHKESLVLTPFAPGTGFEYPQAVEDLKLYWDHLNSTPFPFSAKDGKALKTFLKDHPAMTRVEFRSCLQHKAKSGGNVASQSFYRWLPRLMDYLAGPLDRFNKSTTNGGVKHEQQREVYAGSLDQLSQFVSDHGAGGNDRGVSTKGKSRLAAPR